MWPSIFAKMKAAGLNAVESYVFWNYHVPTLDARDSPDYSGRGNVTLFLELAARADLFVIWRVGPYICAEWPGGGMPGWLREVKDPRGAMHPRSATQPYQDTCRAWMQQHIELVRPYFAQNGGPIVMLQMEKPPLREDPRLASTDTLTTVVGRSTAAAEQHALALGWLSVSFR